MCSLLDQVTNPPKLCTRSACVQEIIVQENMPSIFVPSQATISASRIMFLLILASSSEGDLESPSALRMISCVACLSKVESRLLLLKIVIRDLLPGRIST